MRILFVATRLAGTDGVSLEAAKMRQVFERCGHEVLACAGELGPDVPGHELPQLHFTDPEAVALGQRAFDGSEPDPELETAISRRADALLQDLRQVTERVAPRLLVIQNAWAIPMQLPLALALARLVQRSGLPTLSHNHDYWWERDRFERNRVQALLDSTFPYHQTGVVQLSINSLARAELRRRRGLDSLLLPNVLEFEREPPGLDSYNSDFRRRIGVAPGRPLLLQPTRVVARKGIELAVELCARLQDLRPVLVISHAAGDEGLQTLQALQQQARQAGVDLRCVDQLVREQRAEGPEGKLYSLWDVYPHADLVTYPSLVEGFGNALLEAIWLRKPLLVNRYPVYVSDIAPTGLRLVEIEGRLTEEAVEQVRGLLPQGAPGASQRAREMTGHNLAVAREHFGFATLERVLDRALDQLGLALR